MTTEAELDRRLAMWAAARRLSDAQLAGIRASVVLDAAPTFDAEWLWSMLRPVTQLVELTDDVGEKPIPRRFSRWMNRVIGTGEYQPYLRLA